MTNACLICYKLIAPSMIFCYTHWQEYKDSEHEPWYRGAKNLAQADRRRANRDVTRLTSLDRILELQQHYDEIAAQKRRN